MGTGEEGNRRRKENLLVVLSETNVNVDRTGACRCDCKSVKNRSRRCHTWVGEKGCGRAKTGRCYNKDFLHKEGKMNWEQVREGGQRPEAKGLEALQKRRNLVQRSQRWATEREDGSPKGAKEEIVPDKKTKRRIMAGGDS